MNDYKPQFDRSAFDVAPYVRRVEKPWGWELHWTDPALPFLGKLLHIHAGARLSLQVHEAKTEGWFLISGRCLALREDQNGDLVEEELQFGRGYACAAGQRHRLIGITECEVIEVSTPECGITWRLEDDYNRPDETPIQRSRERGD